MYINILLRFVQKSFKEIKEKHPDIDDKILKASLVYRFLHFYYFEKDISISEIIEINGAGFGFIGPGNGRLTQFLERVLGWSNVFNSHAILHDAFGRFYSKFQFGSGYTYMINERYTPRLIKKSPFFGHITGLAYCFCR